MAVPHPMLSEEEKCSGSSATSHSDQKSVELTTEENRRQADLACQIADPSNNNTPVDTISSAVSRGTMSIGATDEPRTSEESITTGTSGESSVKQVPSEKKILHLPRLL